MRHPCKTSDVHVIPPNIVWEPMYSPSASPEVSGSSKGPFFFPSAHK